MKSVLKQSSRSQVVTVVHYLFIMVITRYYDKIIVLTEREHLQINRTNKQAYIPHTKAHDFKLLDQILARKSESF